MKHFCGCSYLLPFDKQYYLYNSFASAQRIRGVSIFILDSYNYLLLHNNIKYENPDLVILNCANIQLRSQRFTTQMSVREYYLLVLCVCLLPQITRSLFLRRIANLTEQLYYYTYLVDSVEQILVNVAPHGSYQAVERGSVS